MQNVLLVFSLKKLYFSFSELNELSARLTIFFIKLSESSRIRMPEKEKWKSMDDDRPGPEEDMTTATEDTQDLERRRRLKVMLRASGKVGCRISVLSLSLQH
jgi:hypothetical protein